VKKEKKGSKINRVESKRAALINKKKANGKKLPEKKQKQGCRQTGEFPWYAARRRGELQLRENDRPEPPQKIRRLKGSVEKAT